MKKGRVLDLGSRRREYGEIWRLQKELVAARANDSSPDTLILVEHEHVVTLGRRTSGDNFRPQGVPVFNVEGGGDATYHGPGQLVGYPILKLHDHDVHGYLRMLEEVLIRVTRSYGIESERKVGRTGVWAGERKVASIGVAVSNWVTYHGFALNVNPDMTYFRLIRPCGLDPSVITSMIELMGRPVAMEEVKARVTREFSSVVGTELSPAELEAEWGEIKYRRMPV